ncbi:BSD-domain-containing protein [Xylona heveae TC161]|uniref:BSD-domain-containing protein n=1 Tax=Xylona heveae (strain CBS 132557 / TC161) TaxID=1328760 RepID=A0A165FIB0_XYLHT|nr:BSD-domain-containing protein [Xylona heveae TC161]KZF21010.1 BSD-domain-containing protein [Xylona heveae TC161]
MDIAYDHILEEALIPDEAALERSQNEKKPEQGSLNTEFQEAYKAFSASPWGTRLGGIWGNVRKQGETYLEGAKQEYNAASEQASKGFTDLRSSLINRTRSLSLNSLGQDTEGPSSSSSAQAGTDGSTTPQAGSSGDIMSQSESMLSRFKSEAAKGLREIEKAEDAADEALLKFGVNIRNFFRDAVSIAAPSEDAQGNETGESQVLFESRDPEGKRVIHTTRFDAQLHVVHSSLDSFLRDPSSAEYAPWKKDFDVEKKTAEISTDLEKYPELRRAMEKLVPEKVEYAEFWTRYYFLRHVVETEEKRRKELLRAAEPDDEEEVPWDEDSEEEDATTPHQASSQSASTGAPAASQAPTAATAAEPKDTLKPVAGPRRSNDGHSQADSDASYDVVSGATSRTPGSPKEDRRETVNEESDEEDWE